MSGYAHIHENVKNLPARFVVVLHAMLDDTQWMAEKSSDPEVLKLVNAWLNVCKTLCKSRGWSLQSLYTEAPESPAFTWDPVSLPDNDVKLLYAVGGEVADFSLLGQGVRAVVEGIWLGAEDVLKERGYYDDVAGLLLEELTFTGET